MHPEETKVHRRGLMLVKSTSKKRTPSIVKLTVKRRYRTADGLRPQAWPLRASRRDHDPGRLRPWPAGLRGLQWRQIELSEGACEFIGSMHPTDRSGTVFRLQRRYGVLHSTVHRVDLQIFSAPPPPLLVARARRPSAVCR